MTTIFNDIALKQAQGMPLQQANNNAITVKDVIPASEVKNDSVELSNKKEKKGPIKTIKGFIAGVKKFFAAAGEYTKGLVKGVASGAVVGSLAYTGGAAINWLRQASANRAAKKAGEEVATIVKKVPNKLIATVLAVGAVAANLWTASLNATQRQSEIDMRWTGVEPKK